MRAFGRLALFGAASVLAMPGASAAQTTVGLKGGVAFARPSIDSFGSEVRTGETIGGFVSLPVLPRIFVQVEALYTMKGFSTFGFLTEGASARTPYLDFPVLLKVALLDAPARLRPAIFAGAFWGTELSCTAAGDITRLEDGDSCTGRFRVRGTADVGFIFGGALDLDVSNRWFILADGRLQLGMRNLHLDPGSDISRSRTWSIVGGVGYRIRP